MMVAIGIILFILLFGGMGFAVVYQLKKSGNAESDKSVRQDIERAQEFLPFETIRDSMVDLGNHQYRAYIEASSINYNLRTDKEKDIIESSFQRFLNSLTFPITFFVHTKTLDNTRQMKSLEEDIQATLLEYPNLAEYAEVYIDEFSQIHEKIGNTKQKKKYIIVPFDEAMTLTNSTDEEKYEYVVKEMWNRCNLIKDGLNAIGIECKILKTPDVIELATSVYHRSNYGHVEGIVDGDFTNLVVEGEQEEGTKTDKQKLDIILSEALKKIEIEVIGKKRFGVSKEGDSVRKALMDLKRNQSESETDEEDEL